MCVCAGGGCRATAAGGEVKKGEETDIPPAKPWTDELVPDPYLPFLLACVTAVQFSKYQGLGNDFILVDNRHSPDPILSPDQSARVGSYAARNPYKCKAFVCGTKSLAGASRAAIDTRPTPCSPSWKLVAGCGGDK
jgi:hypothetical protein